MTSEKTPAVLSRRARLAKYARDEGCGILVTLEPENLFYMTGFWGEAAGILEGGRITIIASELEAARAAAESPGSKIITAGRGSPVLAELASRMRGKKTCMDCSDYATARSLLRVRDAKHSSAPFERARMVKDSGELAILRRASRIIDGMFELCTQSISKGQREADLQAILMAHAHEHEMFDTGYRHTLNPLIIAGGPNGALPHAQVTGRKFRTGELIVVDITLRHKGYVSDATRTFALGHITDEVKEAYEVVMESQRAGLGAIRPGAPCKDIDSACRDHIESSGLGRYFVHATGHGIGLDVHEAPGISQRSMIKLAKNMAVTVEPGVYKPGKFGVRIEDSVIVGKKPVVMHRFTKNLVTL